MTPKEIHIRIDMAIQHMASNRKGSWEPDYLDLAINEATIDSIKEKLNPFVNAKREGFEESLKRYGDLQSIKRTKTLSLLDGGADIYSAPIPSDVLILLSDTEATINVDYKRIAFPNSVVSDWKYYTLDFPTAITNERESTYNAFTMVLETNTFALPSTYPTFTTPGAKFMIINYIIDACRTKGYEIAWERHGAYYKANSFVIYANRVITGSLTYQDSSIANKDRTVVLDTTLFNKSNVTSNTGKVPVSIHSSKTEFKTPLNKYYHQYRARNPICYIENNMICFKKELSYIPLTVDVSYLKYPQRCNYYTGAVSEMTITDEIINKAVTKLLAMTANPTYASQTQELLKID